MENENRPHVKPGPIKYAKGYRVRVFLSKAFTAIIFLFSLLVLVLSIYIYINEPVKTSTGYVEAEKIYGIIDEGEEIGIVPTEKYGLLSPIKRVLTDQDYYEAKVLIGPYGEIKKKDDKTVVVYADKTVDVNIDTEQEYLEREYIVRKIDENGEELGEDDKIISEDEILGRINVDKEEE